MGIESWYTIVGIQLLPTLCVCEKVEILFGSLHRQSTTS